MKVRLILALALTFGFVTTANAQDAAASPTPAPKPAMSRAQSQRVIIATEKKLWEAWKNKDTKPFKANLAADSVMIMDAGVADKKTTIQGMESMPCDVTSYELSDMKVSFLNNSTAILTYKSTQDAKCGGEQVPAAVWSSSVYVMRSGKWFAASHQETTAR